MMLRIAIALGALGAAMPVAAQDAPLEWLQGNWCTEPNAAGRATCETWVADKDTLVGESRAETAGQPARMLERMRIRSEAGRLVFHADPTGQEGGDFHATGEQPPQSARFENAAHDYPQVVRYWREGDALLAEISLADGGRAMRWKFRRMPQPIK